jgi:hypothetical protein
MIRDDEERRAVVTTSGKRGDRGSFDAIYRRVQTLSDDKKCGGIGECKTAGAVLVEIDGSL